MAAHSPDLLSSIGYCCLHTSALQTSEEERKKLLSFVICGGGPTGVEVAAELHDFVFEDLKVGCLEGKDKVCQHLAPLL